MEAALRQPTAMSGQIPTIPSRKRMGVRTIKELNAYNTIVREEPLIDPNWRERPMCSVDEAFEEAYKHLGSLYGLNDIREAK